MCLDLCSERASVWKSGCFGVRIGSCSVSFAAVLHEASAAYSAAFSAELHVLHLPQEKLNIGA